MNGARCNYFMGAGGLGAPCRGRLGGAPDTPLRGNHGIGLPARGGKQKMGKGASLPPSVASVPGSPVSETQVTHLFPSRAEGVWRISSWEERTLI